MISVGSRDARKGLEQRFSSNRRRDMDDDTELEEGEACSLQEEDETSIDPDVALSYLDEKLQNVLGHFKKDFEGVVSAENLGAKYGIYGSFLPAYRRSPVWSHSRTPPRVQNYSTPQSPSTLRVEGGQHNSLVQANVPHPVKHGSSAQKPPSQNDQCRQTARTHSMQLVEDSTPKSEVRDQRTLKVRIKVGSDNPSVIKNAEIYTGLGLDGSPSSSFGDSPMESEGLSRGLPSDDHDSLARILQLMTSSPLFGGYLLSPLPDHLIQLSERPKLMQDILMQPSSKTSQVNSVTGCPGYTLEDNKTFSVENNITSSDKKGCFLGVKREGDDSHNFGFSVKEEDIDVVSCEKLVSSALKLPLLSDAYSTIRETTKDSMEGKVCSDVVKKEPVGTVPIPVGYSDKRNEKANSAVVDNGAAEMMNDSRKTGDIKGEPATSSTNTNAVDSKSKKASKSGRKDPVKQKADKSTSSEGGMRVPSKKEQLSTGDKKKLKKNQAHNLAAGKVAKESANDHELEHSSTQQDLSKASDKYKDFFGEMNEQEEVDIMDSPDVPYGDRLKTSEAVEKPTSAYESTLRDRASSLETRKGVISGTGFSRGSSAPLLDNGRPISDPAPGGGDADDNWVCCDKCQRWRLLPPGSKVESLPEKWLCSMLTWLPDMNRCSISEEETTTAVRARYQLLVDPNSLRGPLGSLATATSSADNYMLPNDQKIVDKLRKTSKSSFQDSPNQNPSSSRKKQQSAKDNGFIEAKESPLVNGLGFQQLNKPSDTNMEKVQHKKIDKHTSDRESDRGHGKMSKIRSSRDPDQEFRRSSKKSKTRSMQSVDDDKRTAHDQDNEMMVVNSGYSMGTNTVGKGKLTNSGSFRSRKSNHYMDGDSLDPSVKSKSQAEALPDVGSAYASKSDTGNIAPKKRKTDNCRDLSSSTPSSSKLISDGELGSRKKQRLSKSEGKESSGSKRSGKPDKKSKSILRHSLDNTESLRKDSSCAQPVVAATSSSSKVSGSLKVKSKLQELKSSPVESVSSSPLRISNAEKLTTGSKIIVEKDDAREADKLTTVGPRKWSNGDYEGGTDGYSSVKKDITETETHHGSVEPSMIDLQYNSNGDLQQKNGLAQKSPSNVHHGLSTNGCVVSLDSENGYPSEAVASDKFVNDVTGDEGHLNGKVSCSGKFSKGSSELCKDKNQTFKSTSNKGKVKMSESYDYQQDRTPDADNAEKDAICNNQESSIPQSKQDYDGIKSSKKIDIERSEQLSKSTREKSRRLPSDGEKIEMSNSLQPQQGNGASMSSLDAHANDLSKDPKPGKKEDSHNGTHHISSKRPISNGHRVKNQDAPSPLRRDTSSQAAGNALKEAKHLKHLADRMKSHGVPDYTGLYFEAALKFLHAASLLESGKTENVKHGEMTQFMQIYSSTAKLCEFCAHEYERSKDMASAALAYKCMEVAYLRVIYSSHHCASRDRHELQTVLQMVPPGESPSSSASDIDNLNNSAIGDKALHARSGDSPQLATNLVISARNRPNFSRLLSYAQDVNFAMEASRRSRSAFTAANVSMNNGDPKDGMTYIKRALDFNFNDVEGLLRLVRLAKEATNPTK